ncbi:MAG: hypothetical protein ABW061_28340, partial [Polyangiaceae bacterium]
MKLIATSGRGKVELLSRGSLLLASVVLINCSGSGRQFDPVADGGSTSHAGSDGESGGSSGRAAAGSASGGRAAAGSTSSAGGLDDAGAAGV